MTTQRRGGPGQSLGHLPELEPDLVAGEQARLGGLGERHTRADEERLHARDRRVHRLGDLVVRERIDLAQEQRGALSLRELVHVRDDLPELLALVHRVRGAGAAVALEDVHRVLAGVLRAPQVVQRAVARDPVEPGARVDRTVVSEHRVERRGEDLLEDVLSVLLRAEHVPAEGQEPWLVALHQRLERAVVAAPRERDETFITLQPQERRAPCKSRQGW